jgi:hypothetical protein
MKVLYQGTFFFLLSNMVLRRGLRSEICRTLLLNQKICSFYPDGCVPMKWNATSLLAKLGTARANIIQFCKLIEVDQMISPHCSLDLTPKDFIFPVEFVKDVQILHSHFCSAAK